MSVADDFSGERQHPLSVVIATLGGEVLRPTLAMLNSGARVPAEILICVPQSEAAGVDTCGHDNVRIVVTPNRGQVAQRAFGLQQAEQAYVMQMDDDILIEPESVQVLLDAARTLGKGAVVAPLFRHVSSGEYITRFRSGWNGFIDNLYLSAVCGAPWGERRMGKLTMAGMGYWIDRTRIGVAPFETEWIPGGCALCRREDLVLESYFPFPGKAFSEDLIHSLHWRRQGARLWAIPTASCSTEVAPAPFAWRHMVADYRAHLYVVRMMNGTAWRLRLWFVIQVAKQVAGQIRRRIGGRARASHP